MNVQGCTPGDRHLHGESAARPIEPPSNALAALRILAMALAIAAVRALSSRPMAARSGAPNFRIEGDARYQARTRPVSTWTKSDFG